MDKFTKEEFMNHPNAVAQARFDNHVHGVAGSIEASPEVSNFYDVRRLEDFMYSYEGVKLAQFEADNLAEALRQKGYMGMDDAAYEAPESIKAVRMGELAEKMKAGEVEVSASDLRKVYLANVIAGCENTHGYHAGPSFGQGNLNQYLYEAHEIAREKEVENEHEQTMAFER